MPARVVLRGRVEAHNIGVHLHVVTAVHAHEVPHLGEVGHVAVRLGDGRIRAHATEAILVRSLETLPRDVIFDEANLLVLLLVIVHGGDEHPLGESTA
jgi:sorbitol-specific phosphotransferase system component IIA